MDIQELYKEYKSLEEEKRKLYEILDETPKYIEDTEAYHRGAFNRRSPEDSLNLEYSGYSQRLNDILVRMWKIRDMLCSNNY
jgi:hypothetical protein